METIRSSYKGDLRTEAIHVRSAVTIFTDAPPDNQGKGESFSPSDLLAASLGSCMMTIMGIAGRTHNINVEGTTFRITKVMAANPRRVSEVHVEFNMPDRSYTEKEKKILDQAAKTCPVALSLHPDIKQEVKFVFSDEVTR